MNRRDFILMGSAASALALATQCRAAPATDGAVDVVEAFGFVPDGRTDNYAAFHRWADHVNQARGGNYVFPPGTYFVQRYRNWPKAGAAQNALIHDCDGLTISGAGARIVVNGKFHRSATAGRDFATFIPFMINTSRNVRISGLEIDGGIRGMTRETALTEAYAHLIALGGCVNVVLEDLDLHHAMTDGLYLANAPKTAQRPGIACRDVVIRNVRSHNNARGGLGVIQVFGLTCTDSAFNENGYNLGGYGPHAPRFGVDVEPDYFMPADIDVRTGNLEFRRCEFRDNGIAFAASYRNTYQGYLRLIDCQSSNRFDSLHHMILNWSGALIEGGRHDCGIGTLWTSWSGETGGDLQIRDCEIRVAGQYGVFHAHSGNRLTMRGVRIVGTHREAGPGGWVLSVQADPGRGRKNLVAGCDVFVPAARKSRAAAYDYEVSFYHTVSQENLFRTDLPVTGNHHFCTEYGAGAVARGDRYQGSAPGSHDSFRPGHDSAHDSRRLFGTA